MTTLQLIIIIYPPIGWVCFTHSNAQTVWLLSLLFFPAPIETMTVVYRSIEELLLPVNGSHMMGNDASLRTIYPQKMNIIWSTNENNTNMYKVSITYIYTIYILYRIRI